VFSNSCGPSPSPANAPACISVAEGVATPRPTNRGVTNTERVERASALVDWIEWTEHETTVDDVCSGLGSDWIEGDRGAVGYLRSRVSQGIVVFYQGRPGMGVHVRVPGKACRALEASGRVVDWESFLAGLLVRGRSITRLDVALDERAGSVTVERCYRELKAGHLVHRFRTASSPEYMDRLGNTESRSLYFGSAASDLRVRIYDKAIETHTPGPWTRVEVQTRDDHATALARLLTIEDGGARSARLGALLLGYMAFKEPSRDANRSRWATAAWWSLFVGGCTKTRLLLSPARLPTAAEMIGNAVHQYGPSLATVAEVTGYGPIFDAIEGARARTGPRHQVMSARWRAEAESVGL
jgi:Replication initiation factor